MKSTLLEWQQHRLGRVTSGALREDNHALLFLTHVSSGALEGLHGLVPVDAVDKDRAGKGHKPAEERNLAEGFLSRYGAVQRPDGAKDKDVKFSLVVEHEDGGPIGVEDFSAIVQDVEPDAHGEGTEPFETASGGPLCVLVVQAQRFEDGGGDSTVRSADDEGHVGGQHAGNEADERRGVGKVCVEGKQRHGDEGVEGEEVKNVPEEEEHGGCGGFVCWGRVE